MKIAAVMLLGFLATARCPAEPIKDRKERDDPKFDCGWMAASTTSTCDPGVVPIDPRDRLGFNKHYYERTPQPAIVSSVSGASMVLEGPWDMPYTFTWFESLEGAFEVGDEVLLSGGMAWDVVRGPRLEVAQADQIQFSPFSPGRPTEDGPQVDFVPVCYVNGSPDRTVFGVTAALGDEAIELGQGEQGGLGDWKVLFHGAAAAPGYEDDCMIVEGYFHGVVSAWRVVS
ncbi:MAG TPA: hypothetical protein VGD74_03220, partial [Vulgatibacter sp.]